MILTGSLTSILLCGMVFASAWMNWWSNRPDALNTICLFAALALVLFLGLNAGRALIDWFIAATDSLLWSITMATLYIVVVGTIGLQIGSGLKDYKFVRVTQH